jgi:hypothetical protein
MPAMFALIEDLSAAGIRIRMPAFVHKDAVTTRAALAPLIPDLSYPTGAPA